MNNDLYFKYWNVFSSEYQSEDFLSSNVKVDSRQVSLLIKLVTNHDLGIWRSQKDVKAKELEMWLNSFLNNSSGATGSYEWMSEIHRRQCNVNGICIISNPFI